MRCAECGEIIEQREHYVEVEGDTICLGCIMEYLEEFYQEYDGSYTIDGESIPEDEIEEWISDHTWECDEEEIDEIDDPRTEPEYWEER